MLRDKHSLALISCFRLFLTAGFLSLLFFHVTACGGGTVGTDDGGALKIFTGTVKLNDGSVVADALVTILESGESATTDADGEFEIDSNSSDLLTANLLIETNQIQVEANIGDIPEGATETVVEIVIDPVNRSATTKVETRKRARQVRRTPTPVSALTPEPTATATLPITPIPDLTPAATATAVERTVGRMQIAGSILFNDNVRVSGARVGFSAPLREARTLTRSGRYKISILFPTDTNFDSNAELIIEYGGFSGVVTLPTRLIEGRSLRVNLILSISSSDTPSSDFSVSIGSSSILDRRVTASSDMVMVEP